MRGQNTQHQPREPRDPRSEVSQGDLVEHQNSKGTENRGDKDQDPFEVSLIRDAMDRPQHGREDPVQRLRPDRLGALRKVQIGVVIQGLGKLREVVGDAPQVIVRITVREVRLTLDDESVLYLA